MKPDPNGGEHHIPEPAIRPPIEVLYVEDDPGDVRLIREVMGQAALPVNLVIADTGRNALAYLAKKGRYRDAPRPDLILLDLNLPDINGRDLLTRIKRNTSLQPVPVVVLTTSDADEDILDSYQRGASCYVKKSRGLDGFLEIVTHLKNFWFTIVKYPPNPSKYKGI